MEQRTTIDQVIVIDNKKTIVCEQSTVANNAIVIYLHDQKAIVRDIRFSDGEWKFAYSSPDGKDVSNMPRYQNFISTLKARKFPR